MATETAINRHSQIWAKDHPLPLGSRPLAFELLEPATGRKVRSSDIDRHDVYAVFFISNHCPHSGAWEDRLVALAREHKDRAGIVFISSTDPKRFPEDGPGPIAERARDRAFTVPYLIDPDQAVADAYAAFRTPHVFVFRRADGLVYRGTVDDNAEEPDAVTRHYLRDAIEAALAGRAVPIAETEPQGCGIKRPSDPAAGGR
ncbi:MAG: thioredoxin family protein [Candidatus Limnocylindria bacterium]